MTTETPLARLEAFDAEALAQTERLLPSYPDASGLLGYIERVCTRYGFTRSNHATLQEDADALTARAAEELIEGTPHYAACLRFASFLSNAGVYLAREWDRD